MAVGAVEARGAARVAEATAAAALVVVVMEAAAKERAAEEKEGGVKATAVAEKGGD